MTTMFIGTESVIKKDLKKIHIYGIFYIKREAFKKKFYIWHRPGGSEGGGFRHKQKNAKGSLH